MTTLVWFRNDLRVADNPALDEAHARGPVIACFCICAEQWRAHDVSDWRLAFLLRSLRALGAALAERNIPLKLLDTPTFAAVPDAVADLAQAVGAAGVAYNAEYPLNEKRRDRATAHALATRGIATAVHHGGVCLPPGSVLTQKGEPFTVFTPFKRRWLALQDPRAAEPLPAPAAQAPVAVRSDALPTALAGVPEEFGGDRWPGGEAAAAAALDRFTAERLGRYAEDRDHPSVAGTARISHHLSVGTLSATQCFAAAAHAADGAAWVDELIWREFYRHVTDAFARLSQGHAFRPTADRVAWQDAPDHFAAWCEGRTGYPLIDAAMRQLATTGWMHNRLRMLTASFLAKHLLIDWRRGERHFMRHLVDGDFAANNGGWQWSAGTGTDAAPYFRIFNPITQAKRFDADGAFVRRYVPELADVATRDLFGEPWRHADYPAPIVEHRWARQRALDAYAAAR